MKKEDLILLILAIIVSIIILVVGALIGIPVIEQSNMYLQCCNGTPCTDTYYDIETNLCHLTLCENNPMFNQDDCTYEGANITNGTMI